MSRALQVTRGTVENGGGVTVSLRTDVVDESLVDESLVDERLAAAARDSGAADPGAAAGGAAAAAINAGDVLIDVEFSGINYKDGMALAGSPGVMRVSPLIPGIDLVGTVAASASPDWSVGDAVIVNGWGIGETHNGGLAERARVKSEWLIARPDGISARRAAAIGTAGFTAALAVLALEKHGLEKHGLTNSAGGEVLVTGASGGVGSIAIALLTAAGHRVIASTGRPSQREYLLGLGAVDTIDRAELEAVGRPLQKQRWSAVVDSVGGQTLANALAQTVWGGGVAACGLVGGSDIPTTVMPFILRGVALLGINSVECPLPERQAAWARLERDLDLDLLDSFTTSVDLEGAIGAGAAILRGELHGRTVVDVRA
jgi:acrylyl-CoA reductase (NADPH)